MPRQKLITRIGAVNWDCSLPATTFFGGYATRSLSEAQFRERVPYYAIDLGDDKIDFPVRAVAEYETEMRHAIAAGIDYFAYCWYDRQPHTDHLVTSAAANVDEHVCELVKARLMHVQSPLRDQIGLCAILVTSHPYFDEELIALAETMKAPYYEKIGGRPLVYLMSAPWEGTLSRLRAFCRQAGVDDPYAVLMGQIPGEKAAGSIQALGRYACVASGDSYDAILAAQRRQHDKYVASGWPVLPHFSMGWNPQPRVNHPVLWGSYPAVTYHPTATAEQLLAGAAQLKEWVREHADSCPTGNILVFAWNEFEEGGWICPTLGTGGKANTTRRDTFAQIAAYWKA